MHKWERMNWFKLGQPKKCREKTKITLIDVIKNEMTIKEKTEGMTSYR